MKALPKVETIFSNGVYIHKVIVPIKNLPAEFNGFKILQLTDIHFKKNYNKNEERILKLNNAIPAPDLIVATGDYINHNLSDWKSQTTVVMKNLFPKTKKLFITGNHEFQSKEDKKPDYIIKKMEECGFQNLINRKVKLTKGKSNINIFGVDDILHGKPELKPMMDNEKNQTNILLIHNLDGHDQNKNKDFDLILSGHLHDSQMNFGIINGTFLLRMIYQFKNVNKQIKSNKWLSERTFSHISPGFGNWLPRFNVKKAGASLIVLVRE